MNESNSDILITDMRRARPAEAFTDKETTVFSPVSERPAGGWRIIEYESNLHGGFFLQSQDPKAAMLTLPLGLTGWHAVSIGLAPAGVKAPQRCAIEVRLTGQRHWQLLQAEGWGPLAEEPWIMADLTGKSLQVRYPRFGGEPQPVTVYNGVKYGPPAVARLFSIRARPMAEEDVAVLRKSRPRDAMYGTDGHGVLLAANPRRHRIRHFFRAFARSDWNCCFYGGGGPETALYDTRAGSLFGPEGLWDFDALQGAIARNLRAMIASGQNPLAIAVEQAHKQRHPIYVYMRNALWTCEPPLDQVFGSPFHSAHPEYSIREADGTAISTYLSIAFPEVRARMNAMFREYLEHGADGVAICFVRGFPLVRYEEPVLQRFRELHGGDAREAKPDDPRIRQVWIEFTTRWMREIREIADAAGTSAHYDRRKVVIMVGPNPEWCLQWGIDVGQWAKEKLIDIAMPYPRGIEQNPDDGMATGIAEFAELLRGTGVPQWPSLGSFADHNLSLAAYRRRAHRYFAAGADGLSRWDTDSWLARVGLSHSEIQRLWVEKYLPPAGNTLISTAGLNRAYYSPRHGV